MIPGLFIPSQWYWKGPEGIYSSASNAIVPATDATYEGWLKAGNYATPWPFDASGNQNAASLNAVLTSFSLPAYAGS